MKKLPISLICAFSLLSLSANAAGNAGWTDYADVWELTPTIHKRFIVRLIVNKNPSECKNKQFFYQDYNMSGSDKMFNTLLQALTYNKKVRVFVTGNCDLKGLSEISSVTIVP